MGFSRVGWVTANKHIFLGPTRIFGCVQWRHQKFFCGGIEGAKCDSEGAKIQKFAENG